jgi:hypothetical protein
MPVQALVSLANDGQVAVCMNAYVYSPKAVVANGQRFTEYEKRSEMQRQLHDIDKVTVYDMKGAIIVAEDLRRLLRREIVALATSAQLPLDPLHFRVFKEDTLLFVLPGAIQAPAPPPVPIEAIPAVEPHLQKKDEKNKISGEGFKLADPALDPIDSSDRPPWANKLIKEAYKDFGTCERGALLKHTFKFTNIYAVPLDITAIRQSCGCITCSASKKTMQPRETVDLDVTVDTRTFLGAKTMTVYLTIGPKYHSEVRLTVKAESIQPSP